MTGVWLLTRGHLRRDRWMILWWSLGGALLYWSQGVSVAGLYATQGDLDRAASSMGANAAFVATLGPARALDTVGGQIFWQSSAFGAVVAGLMSLFLVGRHTRAEEESGRDELVRSTAIDRRAPLTAALLAAMIANLVMGLLVTLSLITIRQDSPLAGMPIAVADSVATGFGLTAAGWMLSAAALVTAQLTQSARAMYGVGSAVIGAAYGLRAIGDVGNGALSWLSPIGWYQAMHPYSGLRWWPVLLLVAAAVINAAAAYLLFARRDVGSGILTTRPGPATAGRHLRSGLGLAWRLQRGAVIGWTVGLLILGLAYGSIGDSVEDLLGDSEIARDVMAAGGTGGLVDGFYATAIVMLAMMSAGFAISSALRPRGEEDAGHAELLLATGIRRGTWLAGHVAVTVAGTAVVLAGAGLGLGAGYALTTGDGAAVLRYGLPALAYVAPVLLLSAVARLLYGLAPRLLLGAWLPLIFVVVVLMFGEALQLPGWLRDASPFEWMPLMPAENFAAAPALVVAAVVLMVSAAGQLAFRRRDIG